MNDYGFGGVDGRDMAIRELEDRKAAYKQRIAELEAQVSRLQDTLLQVVDNYTDLSLTIPDDDFDATFRQSVKHWLRKREYPGEWTDLDPVKGGDDGE